MTNTVGVIDSGYRGEIMAKMHVTTDAAPAVYKVGEKFAQLIVMPIPEVTISEVVELSESDRGESGFGSSDEKLSAPDASEDNVQVVDAKSDEATMAAADLQNGSEVAE